MGLVTRPSKTGGNTTYVAEVAAGFTTIKATEVDADLDAIINGGVNNIETANIAAAGLGSAAIAANAITTAKIADAAVTAAKLANGATAIQIIQVTGSATTLFTSTDVTLISQAITTTRSKVRITAHAYGQYVASAPVNTTFALAVKRSAVQQYVTPSYADDVVAATQGQDRRLIHSLMFIDTPGVGTFTYTIHLQVNSTASRTGSMTCRLVIEEIA
jgi:hypothetical protein